MATKCYQYYGYTNNLKCFYSWPMNHNVIHCYRKWKYTSTCEPCWPNIAYTLEWMWKIFFFPMWVHVYTKMAFLVTKNKTFIERFPKRQNLKTKTGYVFKCTRQKPVFLEISASASNALLFLHYAFLGLLWCGRLQIFPDIKSWLKRIYVSLRKTPFLVCPA